MSVRAPEPPPALFTAAVTLLLAIAVLLWVWRWDSPRVSDLPPAEPTATARVVVVTATPLPVTMGPAVTRTPVPPLVLDGLPTRTLVPTATPTPAPTSTRVPPTETPRPDQPLVQRG